MTQRNKEAWDRGVHNALLAAGYAKDDGAYDEPDFR